MGNGMKSTFVCCIDLLSCPIKCLPWFEKLTCCEAGDRVIDPGEINLLVAPVMSSAYFHFSLASRPSVIYLKTICQPMALKRKVGKDKVQYLSPMPEMEQSQCSLLTALSPNGQGKISSVSTTRGRINSNSPHATFLATSTLEIMLFTLLLSMRRQLEARLWYWMPDLGGIRG